MRSRVIDQLELLADPTRRRIVGLVALRARRPSDIAGALGLSHPATSRQLRILADAALLQRRGLPNDRRGARYSLERGAAGAIIAWLAGINLEADLAGQDPPATP